MSCKLFTKCNWDKSHNLCTEALAEPVIKTPGRHRRTWWKKGEVMALVLRRARRTGNLATGNLKMFTLRHPKQVVGWGGGVLFLFLSPHGRTFQL